MTELMGLLLLNTIIRSGPIALTAAGAAVSESAGVVNIGLEGMMLSGAFTAAVTSYYTGNPWLGLIAGLITGAVMGGLHGLLTISCKANQIVSGIAVNLFAAGFTVFMMRILFNQSGNTPAVVKLPETGGVSVIVFIAYAIIVLLQFMLSKTVIGLRIRAVGEHPLAAETTGVNVYAVRYFAVIISGACAGIAGAYLSIGMLSQFTKGMSAGRGFMALAAMVFGRWRPMGALWASLLFGFADSVQMIIQMHYPQIPSQLVMILPYVLTIFAVAGFVGKAVPPAADGVAYDKRDE